MDRKLTWFLVKKPAAWVSCIKVAFAILMKRSEISVNREGIRLTVRIGNGRGLFCALAGTEYETEMRWFLGKMKEGDLFVDVGANIGVYTLHASRRVGVKGEVLAFEPTPETFSDLQKNVQSNQCLNVTCEKIALSNQNGKGCLIECGRAASNRISLLPLAGERKSITVRMLDDYCQTNKIRKIDFIKVDIEGGEADFFSGGIKTLKKDKPIILFESAHTGPAYLERDILRELGYNIFLFEKGVQKEAGNDASPSGNIVAIPSAR
jgi:FkbM family methyltransferase